jgi:hypothetical protein
MGRPVVRFEIGCRDKAKTAEFYGALFDWTTQDMGPAAMIATGADEGIQGHITSLGHEPHNYTIFYVRWTTRRPLLRELKNWAERRWCRPCRFLQESLRGWPIRKATRSGCLRPRARLSSIARASNFDLIAQTGIQKTN